VEGIFRFLSRVWRLADEVAEKTPRVANPAAPKPDTPAGASRPEAGEAEEVGGDGEAVDLLRKTHWAIDKVTRDIEPRFQFNTAIAAVMELVNEIYRLKDDLYADPAGGAAVRFATATAASLLFPFAPHLCAEVYERLTGERVWETPWPEADRALLERDTFMLVVQVNGKLRDRVEADSAASEEELLALARGSEKVERHLDGKQVVKEIVVPGKLVNLVVR
jgi:leucyl-tRNA synthetase